MLDPSISYPHPDKLASYQHAAGGGKQLKHQKQSSSLCGSAMACYPQSYELGEAQRVHQVPVVQKDYSKPLHVDCSVEYELPNTAKPPQGVRNEPLLMIHPCYFRKIESQRRSPFVNNLPVRTTTSTSVSTPIKRVRIPRGQQLVHPQVPTQGAQYPIHYQDRNIWEAIHPTLTMNNNHQNNNQSCCGAKLRNNCVSYNPSSGSGDSGHWTDPDRSPDQEKQHLTGKYRQYLRAHRIHPYNSIPIASTFPHQMQQVCYNV